MPWACPRVLHACFYPATAPLILGCPGLAPASFTLASTPRALLEEVLPQKALTPSWSGFSSPATPGKKRRSGRQSARNPLGRVENPPGHNASDVVSSTPNP